MSDFIFTDCQLVCHMEFIEKARITPCSRPKVWNHDIVTTKDPDVSKAY